MGYIFDFQHGDIEHFRPKGAVTNEDDEPIYLKDEQGNYIINEEGKPKPHPGYYWLAYDWRNLLPSCSICNQPSIISSQKIGKHNRFPVAGNHAQFPDNEADELPLLINPASEVKEDAPEKHLSVDPNTGIMSAVNSSKRGNMCIKIFGLNLRDNLLEERLKTCREIKYLLVEIIHGRSEHKIQAIAKLKAIKEGKKPYTLAALNVLKEYTPLFNAVFNDI